VRYRLMATYQGSPFEAGLGPGQGEIVLFAACPPPESLGFEPATGHWRKQVRLAEVQAVWESRPVGAFRGERCMVLDDLGDRLHIGYLGHDGFRAEQLGYWQVDRGVFELVAPRSEVTDIREERTEYPRLPAASLPVTGPQPTVSADSSGPPRPSERPSGQYSAPAGHTPGSTSQRPVPGSYSPGSTGQHTIPVAYMSLADTGSGIALPVAAPAPLPLEAEALRAASARRTRAAATSLAGRPAAVTSAKQWVTSPATSAPPAKPAAAPPANPAAEPQAAAAGTSIKALPDRSARARLATEVVFADLAALAGLPAGSYAIGEAVDGAMCLVQTEQGFEVFTSVLGGRQELQKFETEEAACFYLLGVLTAEAIRNGSLARATAGLGAGSALVD
jgi:hypothetical protein